MQTCNIADFSRGLRRISTARWAAGVRAATRLRKMNGRTDVMRSVLSSIALLFAACSAVGAVHAASSDVNALRSMPTLSLTQYLSLTPGSTFESFDTEYRRAVFRGHFGVILANIREGDFIFQKPLFVISPNYRQEVWVSAATYGSESELRRARTALIAAMDRQSKHRGITAEAKCSRSASAVTASRTEWASVGPNGVKAKLIFIDSGVDKPGELELDMAVPHAVNEQSSGNARNARLPRARKTSEDTFLYLANAPSLILNQGDAER